MATTTTNVKDAIDTGSSKWLDLQPNARRQVSLPTHISSRLSNNWRPSKTAHVPENDFINGTIDKNDVPSQSLTQLPEDRVESADSSRNVDKSVTLTFHKRQRGHSSSETEKQVVSKCVSSSLRRRLTKTACVYLHLGFPQGHKRRSIQNADLIIVHTSTQPLDHEAQANTEAPAPKGTHNWQPVAWAHSLPCVVNIPITPESFALTHVNISFNIACRRVGAANAMLVQLSNLGGSSLKVTAPTREAVIGNLLVSIYVPPVRSLKCKNIAPGVAITVKMAPSMRRNARHVVQVRLERAASGVTPLPVAEERIIRRGERQVFLAASSEALLFALDARQTERAELHVVWKGASKRGGDVFTHGVWRIGLASLRQLHKGQLHALPWCEAPGLPVVMRSLLIGMVTCRNDLWWCITATLTR